MYNWKVIQYLLAVGISRYEHKEDIRKGEYICMQNLEVLAVGNEYPDMNIKKNQKESQSKRVRGVYVKKQI